MAIAEFEDLNGNGEIDYATELIGGYDLGAANFGASSPSSRSCNRAFARLCACGPLSLLVCLCLHAQPLLSRHSLMCTHAHT